MTMTRGAGLTAFVTINGRVFTCDVALTPEEHARGLQWRAPLLPDHGLLFVFPDDRPRTFWMGAVSFPIDIAFLGLLGDVRRLVRNAAPGTAERWTASAKYVLETNGGAMPENARILVRVASSAVVRRADYEIQDVDAFLSTSIEGLVAAIANGSAGIPWKRHSLTLGQSESAIVDREVLEEWFTAAGVMDAEAAASAAMTPDGLRLLEFELGNFADIVTRTPQGIVLQRHVAP